MRYLILSDLHGNLEALEAVLEATQGQYDEIVCCGDLVGYGADPNAMVEWTRERTVAVVRGNHDKACSGSPEIEWFNPAARQSALWTLEALQSENLAYLQQMRRGPLQHSDFRIFHGSPMDEDEYISTPFDAAQCLPYLESEVSFFGHTHLQGGFALRRGQVYKIDMVDSEDQTAMLDLEADWFYMINPGSVGQPRDGDPRAACAIYDEERRSVKYFRTHYDLGAAQHKILEAGMPDLLAFRLSLGR